MRTGNLAAVMKTMGHKDSFDGKIQMRRIRRNIDAVRTFECDLCPLQESVTRQRDVKGVRNNYVLSLT
jgi:hypothetical protein